MLSIAVRPTRQKPRRLSRSRKLLLRRWRRREFRPQIQVVVVKSPHKPDTPLGEEDTECVRHRERLLHISQRLSQQNLQDLLFLVHDIIVPTACLSTIDSCTELFQELQQKGYVGENNYSKLKRWLVEIGRMDLARELPGTQIKEDQQMTVVNKRKQSHRFLMLQVSESLCKAEVQKLVYLCPAIPQSLHETITEGFQLFQELEHRGLISPENYGYIAECLRCIGREDLAWKLILHQNNIPSSLHSFRQVEQMFSFFCRQKRQAYEQLLTELETTTTRQAWMKQMQEIMPKIAATWNRKAVLHGLIAIDEAIRTTLVVAFSFKMSEAEVISAVMKGDTRELRRSSEKCHRLYREFDQALEQIGWNPSTRHQILQFCSGRKAPHGKAADMVSRNIQSFCREFLGQEGMEIEFENVNESIHKLESTYYHTLQTLSMMEWISDLISLGQTSAVDLHRHMATLTQLLLQHKHIIVKAMPSLSDIIGKEITDLTTPLLSHAPPEDLTDETSLQTGSGDILITAYTDRWIVYLLELIAVASGHRVNHKQVGEAFNSHVFRNPTVMTAGMEYADSVKRLLYAQVAECKKTAMRAATHGPQGCSDVISELFQ